MRKGREREKDEKIEEREEEEEKTTFIHPPTHPPTYLRLDVLHEGHPVSCEVVLGVS